MLDQNTDRMWYVIGAVLIGAAIIFGASTLMPETLASVSDSFVHVSQKISDELHLRTSKNEDGYKIDVGDTNIYKPYTYNSSLLSNGYRLDLKMDVMDINPEGYNHLGAPPGLVFSSNIFEEGARYNLRFNIKVNDGYINTIGGHSALEEDVSVFIDGKIISNSWTGGNYNYFPKDYDVHQIDVLFTYGLLDPDNKYHSNPNIYIQPNRHAGVITDYNLDITDIEILKVGD